MHTVVWKGKIHMCTLVNLPDKINGIMQEHVNMKLYTYIIVT